jgi:hypothetical protein
MSNFVSMPGRASGNVAAMVAIASSIAAALTAVVVVSSLIARVDRLESDLGTAQAKIVELTASQSRLTATIDTANSSIKSLRSDLNPQVRPLASMLDAGALPGR